MHPASVRGRRDDPLCLAFGARLLAARRRLGWTQAWLCELAAVPLGDVSLYEHGLRWPRTPTAVRLGQALGVSLDWLLAGQGEAPPGLEVPHVP